MLRVDAELSFVAFIEDRAGLTVDEPDSEVCWGKNAEGGKELVDGLEDGTVSSRLYG